jgi:hypothetical protein
MTYLKYIEKPSHNVKDCFLLVLLYGKKSLSQTDLRQVVNTEVAFSALAVMPYKTKFSRLSHYGTQYVAMLFLQADLCRDRPTTSSGASVASSEEPHSAPEHVSLEYHCSVCDTEDSLSPSIPESPNPR